MTDPVKPFALKDAPALIERLLPVQKLSAEAYKEQMAGSGKTLTALGSYWKGRKPLILNKACILGCLLPATNNPKRNLEIFEKLMAMDDESFVARWPRRPKPREILATLSIARIADYFSSDPPMLLPLSAPVDWSKPELKDVKVYWRDDIPELERRQVEAQMLPKAPYRQRVDIANGLRKSWKPSTPTSGTPSTLTLARTRTLFPVGRATRHHALRPSSPHSGHLLRLRSDSLRGRTTRLRRVCFRPQPCRLHADVGGVPYRRRLAQKVVLSLV